MACGDVRVGCVQRCVSNFQAGGLAGKRYQCALLLGAVREWQQRSSDSKRAMNLSHVRNRCVGWICRPRYTKSLCSKVSSLDFFFSASTCPSALKGSPDFCNDVCRIQG